MMATDGWTSPRVHRIGGRPRAAAGCPSARPTTPSRRRRKALFAPSVYVRSPRGTALRMLSSASSSLRCRGPTGNRTRISARPAQRPPVERSALGAAGAHQPCTTSSALALARGGAPGGNRTPFSRFSAERIDQLCYRGAAPATGFEPANTRWTVEPPAVGVRKQLG
jgi:hypothetical protein